MATLERKAGNGRFLAGLAIGLVVGAAAACAGTIWLIDFKQSRAWIDAGAHWVRLPSHEAAGDLPQTFAIPAKAYDYGATTLALSPVVTERPSVIRVTLGAVQGSVGVSVDRPDGSALISGERPVTAKDSGKSVYFRVSGREGLVALLVRNYAAEGQPGSVTVNSVAFAPEDGLSKAQLSEINKAGLN
jgi:hypothetical protein